MTRLLPIAILCACTAQVTEYPPDASTDECDTYQDCDVAVCCYIDGEQVCMAAGDCEPDGQPL